MRQTRIVPPSISLALLALGVGVLPACGGSSEAPASDRFEGQSDFTSAPFATQGGMRGGADTGAPSADGKAVNGAAPTSSAPRTVEETDLYRLEGDRLYYLNAYRGLMVFDVSVVDAPKLLGRAPIFGSPVEMVVRNGIATVVVGDWYGRDDKGVPFHGSVVRAYNAQNPASIQSLGEARVAGWVRDTRVVGDVLYTVSEDYGWNYGWYYGVADVGGGGVAVSPGGGGGGPKILVSSIAFGASGVQAKGVEAFSGYGGVFNVTPNSIVVAQAVPGAQPYSQTDTTQLTYIDISDPAGTIRRRGAQTVAGTVQGWGPDNGRWNLDFADQHYAHVIARAPYQSGSQGYILSTVDFGNPDVPSQTGTLAIGGTSYSVAARFDQNRLYLAPESWSSATTPVQIYDVATPATPKFAGSVSVPGVVWNFIPAGNRVFAIGQDYGTSSSKVSLQYLDVSNPASPSLIGTSTFGDGWAWTPAAGTFKAFTKDDGQGLVVLPFSGWSNQSYSYKNGVQLIEFTSSSITTKGAANTKGWVERGIFVKGRVVSLSDLALSVIDITNRSNPTVVKELTLARNIVNARPDGATIAELSSDWWGNDTTKSEIRVLPIGNADEMTDTQGIPSLDVPGVNARVFRNGNLAYVVTSAQTQGTCGTPGNTYPCTESHPKVTAVNLATGAPVALGSLDLPSSNGYFWGFWGCYWYDWFDGSDVVQVGGDKLAFRRWTWTQKADGTWDGDQLLYVVNMANPAAPALASVVVTPDKNGWWGNMRVVGNTLYTSHYEWFTLPGMNNQGIVKYYLDQVDLSNPASPKVGNKINVPGVLVGASETDPSILYTMDYRWTGSNSVEDFAVLKVSGSKAYLQSYLTLDGYSGNVFVRGTKAYLTTERYNYLPSPGPNDGPKSRLHEIDLTNPKKPVDRVSSDKAGWGWLLGVEGDRAIVTSGWGGEGIDIYRLSAQTAPAFDDFVRTRGWGAQSLARQGDDLFLASGYWGVQTVHLKK